MNINREMVTQGGLKALNKSWLKQWRLRGSLAADHIEAVTIYWRFKAKKSWIDETSTDGFWSEGGSAGCT
jgi:hypothetical protein